MKPTIAAQTVFAIPELASVVFAHLTQRARARRLYIHDAHDHLMQPFTILLYNNHFLTHLTLPLVALECDRVSHAVSRLRHLQHVTVLYWKEWAVGSRGTLSLLKACLPLPNLTELNMNTTVYWYDEEEEMSDDTKDSVRQQLETIVRESAIARFSQNPSASKIKLLHLPICWGIEMNPLLVPFLTSGLLDLESFTMPWVFRCQETWEVERSVREHCPKLRRLTYQTSWGEEGAHEDEEYVRAFIRGCSGLESFSSRDFSALSSHGDQPIISDLIAHHCSTLRDFELKNCYRLSSRYQQAILSRCKQLRRFWVTSFRTDSIGFLFTDASRRDWVCMELRELRLTLNLHFKADLDNPKLHGWTKNDALVAQLRQGGDSFVDMRPVAVARRRLLTQIGRLSKLEKLTLDIARARDTRGNDTTAEEEDYQWELTLANGQLAQLAGLKNLRTLRLDADFWTRMGQAEVEFMYEHWPLLEEIILVGKRASKLRTLSHWQWLFKERPQLVFTTHSKCFDAYS
ncbi:hypothetical protein BGZ70_005672 [Mortierella alpina]|uniref:F-box domain-containing protein n=1 Tax=Mortierella alpina TaxID=64518 RepID=A0A9P6JAW3_MORAP|nr:hypothetical protein BGZ70_005672 [Mortierella alpina]